MTLLVLPLISDTVLFAFTAKTSLCALSSKKVCAPWNFTIIGGEPADDVDDELEVDLEVVVVVEEVLLLLLVEVCSVLDEEIVVVEEEIDDDDVVELSLLDDDIVVLEKDEALLVEGV